MRFAYLSFLLFSSLVHCNPCPEGYTLSQSGDDCYMTINFYDTFATQYFPKSYDEAEIECNKKSGGLITSVHSWEDNKAIGGVSCGQHPPQAPGTSLNIGLRCQGKVCKWDDGTPITYTYFRGDGPQDDGRTRCYAYAHGPPSGQWEEQSCGKQEHDCWACRVKAKTIDCVDGETEYKGGCVSVHSTPLDQKTAEESCPGGGHLVSIHSLGDYGENGLYTRLALAAGVNGTIYIGGQYTNGVFEWTDGTYYNTLASNWANSFPNPVFGSCVQMLLASEFGVQGQWTNIDCSEKQPYFCFRDGADYSKYITTGPPQPIADPHCPPLQSFTGNGTFYSPNFPLSIPANISCEYVVETEEGTVVSVRFPVYDCNGGTHLILYSVYPDEDIYLTSYTDMSPDSKIWTDSKTNVLKLIFKTSSPLVGQGWEIEFRGNSNPYCCM